MSILDPASWLLPTASGRSVCMIMPAALHSLNLRLHWRRIPASALGTLCPHSVPVTNVLAQSAALFFFVEPFSHKLLDQRLVAIIVPFRDSVGALSGWR